MGLGNQFQTIVYYEDTGDIREILPNQYIKSRKALNRLLGLPESRGMKFFYIPGYFPLEKKGFKVILGSSSRCPKLVTVDGKDAVLILAQQEAVYIMETNRGIEYTFEGGMGDYIDQAGVVIAMQKKYRDKIFKVVIEHDSRKKALEMLEGWEKSFWASSDQGSVKKLGKVDMNGIRKINGWAPAGKIGVYSAIGGLEDPAPRARIVVTPEMVQEAEDKVLSHAKTKNPYILILHTVSGPTNTKSIPPRAAIVLLSPILRKRSVVIVHVGGAGEEVIDHPQILSLQGKLPWEKVLAVMSIAHGCICIDSAVMHIAQHLPLPTVSFWGPTDPVNIIGDKHNITTVQTTANCGGCSLWDCKDVHCMSQFNSVEISAAFKGLGIKL